MFDEERPPLPDNEGDKTSTHKAMSIFGIFMLIIIGVILLGCGPQPVADDPLQSTTVTVEVAPPPIPMFQITEPATVPVSTAIRVAPPTTTVPLPTAEDICNSITYRKLDPEPARLCYVPLAHELGWDDATIAKWDTFLMTDVLKGESVHCPAVMGGADAARISYDDCSIPPGAQGRRSDAGFFQIVGDNYAPGSWLCKNFGYCSAASIIQSPYHSMRAGLLFVMYDGKGPWCYNADAVKWHPGCRTVTRYWP